MSKSFIPVVDLGQLGLRHESEPSDLEWQRVGKEITDAFKDIGFVYLKRHGIPEDKFNRLVNVSQKFFNLPVEVKNKYPRDPVTRQGYVTIGRHSFRAGFKHELRENYDFKTADGLFPDDVTPDFRPAATEIRESFHKLAKRILVAVALGLGLNRNIFLEMVQGVFSDENESFIRLLHYPPVPSDVQPNTTRCGTHSDYGIITLLFQDDAGGLSVRNRDNEWVNADPIEGTILVNIGDSLQTFTSGKLIATEHKVLIPAEELRQRRCRRSTVFFVAPDNPVLVHPLEGSSDFEPITYQEYLEKKLSEVYEY